MHGVAQSTAPMARLPGVPALEVGMATDPGRDPNKQINEDAMLARDTPHGHLAVVCDGMGGHVGGREASHLAIETIFRLFDSTPPGVPPQQILGDALRQANAAVYARGLTSPELKGMGSTCVALLTHPGGSEVAHVGDSRVYLLTQGQVYQVTKDHSLVQRLVDANMLTPEQAANHPNANQITNAFGQRPDCEVEIRPQPFPHTPGDTFLLCSDGLSDEVGPQDILQILAPHPPCDVAARALIDLANSRGGHDNITVILVRFPGGGPFTPPPMAGAGGSSITATIASAPAQTTTAEMEIVNPLAATMAGAPPGVPGSTPPSPGTQPFSSPQFAAPASAPPAFVPPPAYASAPTPIEPQRKKSSKGLVIGIVVVLLLVAAGVGAAVVLGDRTDTKGGATPSASVDDDDDDPNTPPTSTSANKPKPIPTPSQEPEPSNPRPKHSGPHPPTTTTAPTTTTTTTTDPLPGLPSVPPSMKPPLPTAKPNPEQVKTPTP